MLRFKLISMIFSLVLISCGKDRSKQEQSLRSLNQLCPPKSNSLELWKAEFSRSPEQWAQDHGVVLLSPIPQGLMIQFNRELNQIPEPLRSQLAKLDSPMELLIGRDLYDHPTEYKEPHWRTRIGVGGSIRPFSAATIVVNRMYVRGSTGSTNVALHEYGHWVEMWLAELGHDWRPDFTDAYPEEYEALESLCGSHCQWPHERYAEGFAAYFTCDRSRQWMLDNMPQISKIFKDLAETGFPAELLNQHLLERE